MLFFFFYSTFLLSCYLFYVFSYFSSCSSTYPIFSSSQPLKHLSPSLPRASVKIYILLCSSNLSPFPFLSLCSFSLMFCHFHSCSLSSSHFTCRVSPLAHLTSMSIQSSGVLTLPLTCPPVRSHLPLPIAPSPSHLSNSSVNLPVSLPVILIY